MPEERGIIIDGRSGRVELAEVAGSTALALGEIAQPMVEAAKRLSAHFSGLGSLSNPEINGDTLTEPFMPPFADGRLQQLEKLLCYSYEAAAVMRRLVDVLTTDNPEYVLKVILALRSGRLLPVSGDDKSTIKQKLQQASRLGVADEDLLLVARTPQISSFLGLGHWYMARRLDAETVLNRIHSDLNGYGDEERAYAKIIEESYSDYRRHASGMIGTAQREFGVAVAGLDQTNLVELSGASLDSGMRKSRQYVNDLARSIDLVGVHAVASLRDSFEVQRTSSRARIAAVSTVTLMRQVKKMFRLAQVFDNGYLLAVTAPADVINGGFDRVLNGITDSMEASVAALKLMVTEHLMIKAADDDKSLALTDGNY